LVRQRWTLVPSTAAGLSTRSLSNSNPAGLRPSGTSCDAEWRRRREALSVLTISRFPICDWLLPSTTEYYAVSARGVRGPFRPSAQRLTELPRISLPLAWERRRAASKSWGGRGKTRDSCPSPLRGPPGWGGPSPPTNRQTPNSALWRLARQKAGVSQPVSLAPWARIGKHRRITAVLPVPRQLLLRAVMVPEMSVLLPATWLFP
jgi:hypothetical protein